MLAGGAAGGSTIISANVQVVQNVLVSRAVHHDHTDRYRTTR